MVVQVKKEEKKVRIINAAMDLFVEKGLDNVSMTDIAKKARVGKGTLYLYFTSKDDLIMNIIERVYGSFTEDIYEAAEKASNAEEFISVLIDNMFHDIEKRAKILSLFHEDIKMNRKIYKDFKEKYRIALSEAYKKFSGQFTVNFKEFYFLVTSLLMSAYIFSKEEDLSWVKETFRNLIKKAAL